MVTEVQGRSPWYLAWERLRRNKIALGFGVLFLLLVLFSLAAPLWADHDLQQALTRWADLRWAAGDYAVDRAAAGRTLDDPRRLASHIRCFIHLT